MSSLTITATILLLIASPVCSHVVPEESQTSATTCNNCCQGPGGIPGIPGVPGSAGPLGALGPKGEVGGPGLSVQGVTGEIGETGPPGPEGPQGDSGIGGPPGKMGPVGIQGPPGQDGLLGSIGQKGEKGDAAVLGSIGQKGEKGDAAVLGSIGQKGEKGDAAVTRRFSGFTARKTSSQTGANGDTVTFDLVITDAAGHYDASSSKFTCQIPGYYLFTFAIGARDSYAPYVSLVKNGIKLIDAYINPSGTKSYRNMATNSALLNLVSGDQVWIMKRNSHQIYASATYQWTTFSGVLLHEMG